MTFGRSGYALAGVCHAYRCPPTSQFGGLVDVLRTLQPDTSSDTITCALIQCETSRADSALQSQRNPAKGSGHLASFGLQGLSLSIACRINQCYRAASAAEWWLLGLVLSSIVQLLCLRFVRVFKEGFPASLHTGNACIM